MGVSYLLYISGNFFAVYKDIIAFFNSLKIVLVVYLYPVHVII